MHSCEYVDEGNYVVFCLFVATSRQGHSALLVSRGVIPMQEEVDNNAGMQPLHF